jgi:hypothetical protein
MKTSSSKTTANSPNLTKDALIRVRVTTRLARGCFGAGVSGGRSCPLQPLHSLRRERVLAGRPDGPALRRQRRP